MFYIEETLSDGTTVRMAEGFETAEKAHDYFSDGYWRERAGSARIKRDLAQDEVNAGIFHLGPFYGEAQRVMVKILPRDGFVIGEKAQHSVYGENGDNQCWVRILGKNTYLFEVYLEGAMEEPRVVISRAMQDPDGSYWLPVRDTLLSNFVPEATDPEYNVPSEYTTDFTPHLTFYVGDVDSDNGALMEIEVVGAKRGTYTQNYARQDFKWRILDNGVIVIGGTYTSKAMPLAVWDVASRVVEGLTVGNYEEDEIIPFHPEVSRESRDWVYRAQGIFTHPYGIV